MTAASVPGGDASDVPEDGYGPGPRERLGHAAAAGHHAGQPGQGRGAWPEAGADWPAAGQGGDGGEATPAQVFRPEYGRSPAPDEAETDPGEPETGPGAAGTDAPTASAAVEEAPPMPSLPPEPAQERPAPPGHGWDDGLIARRAPRTPAAVDGAGAAGPTARTTGRGTPVSRSWQEYDDAGARTAGGEAQERCPDAPHRPVPLGEHAEGGAGPRAGSPEGAAPQGTPEGRPGEETPAAGAHAAVDAPGDDPLHTRAAAPTGGGGLPSADGVGAGPIGGTLRRRLSALRELIGLSRTRLEGRVLAEAGRVLDEAGARAQLSAAYTTVAIAGATGSGKSSLLNALAGRTLSETGLRRPTTAQPVACTWEAEREGGADGLLDRLGIAPTMRRRVKDAGLHGLVLIDLPDHDSVALGHREHVDRLLELVDAVVWVVDPEKYADAVLHERYLRPLAGYAEVTFVVLNQVDRLPGEAADAVLHDLRRLLDEDGMALGDYGEPGARVLATSALTGEGLRDLREELGTFAATRQAPARRLTADLDGAAERLRDVYADPALPVPAGLTDADREEFEDLLASAVGACAAGQAAERAWLRHAERSCGTPWSQLVRWRDERARRRREPQPGEPVDPGEPVHPSATRGRGRQGAVAVRVARPVLAQAVRQVADRAAVGLPAAWRKTVRDAAWRGAEGLPEALDALVTEAAEDAEGAGDGAAGEAERAPGDGGGRRTAGDHVPARMPRPPWWTAAMLAQGLLLSLQVVGVFLLVGATFGAYQGEAWPPVLLVVGCAVCAPALAAGCRAAARGPARAYGQEEERRLRRLSAGCGRTRVLEPVAAELLRYREVREQYVVASGDADRT